MFAAIIVDLMYGIRGPDRTLTLHHWASILINSLPMLSGLDPLLRRGLELQTLYPFQTADG